MPFFRSKPRTITAYRWTMPENIQWKSLPMKDPRPEFSLFVSIVRLYDQYAVGRVYEAKTEQSVHIPEHGYWLIIDPEVPNQVYEILSHEEFKKMYEPADPAKDVDDYV